MADETKNEKQHFQNAWICKLLGYQEDKYLSWTCRPRYIDDLYEAGILNDSLRDVYEYIRNHANEMGDCVISAKTIVYKVFKNKVSVSYVNKLLRELRRLRLVYYEDHNGVGGNFTIKVDDFFLPNGQKTDISKYFTDIPVAGENTSQVTPTEIVKMQPSKEVTPQLSSNSSRSEEPNNTVNTPTIANTKDEKVAGNNTNTNTESNTELIALDISSSYKEGIGEKKTYEPIYTTQDFDFRHYARDNSLSEYEVHKTWELATKIGDKYMDRLLIALTKCGFWAIENAAIKYNEDRTELMKKGKTINNPPAFFNTILTKIIATHLAESKKL